MRARSYRDGLFAGFCAGACAMGLLLAVQIGNWASIFAALGGLAVIAICEYRLRAPGHRITKGLP